MILAISASPARIAARTTAPGLFFFFKYFFLAPQSSAMTSLLSFKK
jgi:hypothetical protein